MKGLLSRIRIEHLWILAMLVGGVLCLSGCALEEGADGHVYATMRPPRAPLFALLDFLFGPAGVILGVIVFAVIFIISITKD